MARRPIRDASARIVKGALWRVGARLSARHIYALDHTIDYLVVGQWLRAQGFTAGPLFGHRNQLYAALARPIANQRVLYLEFGVYRGRSMRIWSELLRHPETALHGFDSFEGLPEVWNAANDKGAWNAARAEGRPDVKLELPRFDDPRVVLHQGWFEDTLPSFALPEHERLVVHLDADLYSSTKFVLETLKDAIQPGTLLLFDEFADRQHELRAFDEFLTSSGMRFRFRGGAFGLAQCAFERVG